ncbi:opioid growth factor receptor-like [Labrus mixtus]|uniref:opioid growth factor receptor-like n=1 Tax=Labrus mixtus TaxID=508554 RepID=UPI0029BFD393|nr:opioid growth factor receptor-like [Labrus mixtus]
MSRVNFSRLCRLIKWLKHGVWHVACFSLRCIVAVHRAIVGSSPVNIGWPKDRGSTRDEPETSKKLSERVIEEGVEATSDHESENEAVAGGERPAETEPEPSSEQYSEDDDDDFDSKEYRVETTDDFYCDYDSSWEIEETQEEPLKSTWRPARSSSKFRRFQAAAIDMQNYRHNYPNQRQSHRWNEPDAKPNLSFYQGHTATLPDKVCINNFHDDWFQRYDKLEYVHTYIQWLFPLPEPGMNSGATTLTVEEIHEFCKSNTAKDNLLKSYKLMLDFYGIHLCDETTGEVERALNWRERFFNLDCNTHNNLRITRILKCLGILGFPHYQAPLVHFFLKETLLNGELPRVKESVLNYFMFSVRDKRERRSLIKFAFDNHKCKDEFVWCPKKIQLMWLRRSESELQKGMNRYESEQ